MLDWSLQESIPSLDFNSSYHTVTPRKYFSHYSYGPLATVLFIGLYYDHFSHVDVEFLPVMVEVMAFSQHIKVFFGPAVP